jgi:rhamnosyltransferase
MTPSTRRVLAVVVTFHPEQIRLLRLMELLCEQVDSVLVVDNTPDELSGSADVLKLLLGSFRQLRIRRLGENRGIAAAQNIGIQIAIEEGYEHVLFSDQDSLPAEDMVANLLLTSDELHGDGVAVGCICPAYFDEMTQQPFSFQVQRPGHPFYSTVPGDTAQPWVEIITTISSGSLMPVSTLRRVGGMREDFFIDDVDTEWCHRARSLGFRNFGTSRARLSHRLGSASFRIWYFGWRKQSEYSPTRLYYRFRNFALMVRLPHVPARWSLRAAWYWLGNIYAHSLYAEHRCQNIGAILWGLWDGVRGQSGPAKRDF